MLITGMSDASLTASSLTRFAGLGRRIRLIRRSQSTAAPNPMLKATPSRKWPTIALSG